MQYASRNFKALTSGSVSMRILVEVSSFSSKILLLALLFSVCQCNGFYIYGEAIFGVQ